MESTDTNLCNNIYICHLYINICLHCLEKRPVSESFQVMMNIQLLPWCIALLSIAIPITWRVLYYVLPFEIFYIPAFLKEVKSKNARIIFTILFVLLYTVITIWGMTQKIGIMHCRIIIILTTCRQ